jgi:hypothetical protein
VVSRLHAPARGATAELVVRPPEPRETVIA